MAPGALYSVLNLAILPPWLLLAVLPHRRITHTLVHAIWIPLILTPFDVWALFLGPPLPEGAGFGDLPSLTRAFQSPTAVLAGWTHYLVFDLFVGAWIVREARRERIDHWRTVPLLFATLMAGPVGLAAYLLLRTATTHRIGLDEAPARGSSPTELPPP